MEQSICLHRAPISIIVTSSVVGRIDFAIVAERERAKVYVAQKCR